MMRHLRRAGYRVGRKRIRRLMGLMGLRAIYQKANTSRPHPHHRVFPYLLRGLQINRSGQVWTADISYIPMQRGFFLPGSRDGLGQPQGFVLAFVQHSGG